MQKHFLGPPPEVAHFWYFEKKIMLFGTDLENWYFRSENAFSNSTRDTTTYFVTKDFFLDFFLDFFWIFWGIWIRIVRTCKFRPLLGFSESVYVCVCVFPATESGYISSSVEKRWLSAPTSSFDDVFFAVPSPVVVLALLWVVPFSNLGRGLVWPGTLLSRFPLCW